MQEFPVGQRQSFGQFVQFSPGPQKLLLLQVEAELEEPAELEELDPPELLDAPEEEEEEDKCDVACPV